MSSLRDPLYDGEVPLERAEDFTQGDLFKMRGMALAEGAAAPTWKERWRSAIETLAVVGDPFTSDDVREIAGPPDDHPNAAGSLFHTAARAGLIRAVGYRKSSRDVLHSHPLTMWQGVR